MKKNIYTPIIALIPVIMLMVPLVNPVLYVLFGIDVAAVIALGAVTFIRKLGKKDLLFVPRFVLVWVLFNIALVVSLSRNILTTESFENQNKISSFLFGKNTSTINIIISVVIFLGLTIIGLIIGNTGKNRLKNQWKSVKNEGNKEKIEFYGSLDGSFRFLNGAFVFVIFIKTAIEVTGSGYTPGSVPCLPAVAFEKASERITVASVPFGPASTGRKASYLIKTAGIPGFCDKFDIT